MKLDDLPERYQAQVRPQLIEVMREMNDADVKRKMKDMGFTPKRIRQDPKPILNKLETEALTWLYSRYDGGAFYRQAIRWRLGNGIWYKPDINLFHTGVLRCFEVKGPHAFRGGFENLKVAAGLYPEVQFWLIWKANGQWCEQAVLS